MQVIVAGALGVRSAGLYSSRCMVRLLCANLIMYNIFKNFYHFFFVCLPHIALANFSSKNFKRFKNKKRLQILRCNC